MKAEKFNIVNYRGASSLQLEFNDRLNVFYGVNGAGKSTVLDAIAIMLSWVVSRIRHSGASGRPVLESDIKNGTSSSSLEMISNFEARKVSWKLVKNKKGHAGSGEKSDFQNLSDLTKGIQARITEQSGLINLPVLIYYPVNRAVLDIPLRIREKHSFDLLAAYDDALTTGANFRTFF